MRRDERGPWLNTNAFCILAFVSVASTLSVLGSGHETYIAPTPLDDHYDESSVAADPSTLPPSSAIVYSLDVIKNGSRDERIGRQPLVIRQGATSISGWSFDAEDGRPSLAVYTRLDLGPTLHFPTNIPRPDVVQVYNNVNVLQCGFNVPIDIAHLKPGRHKLSIWLTTSDGLAATRAKPLLLTGALAIPPTL